MQYLRTYISFYIYIDFKKQIYFLKIISHLGTYKFNLHIFNAIYQKIYYKKIVSFIRYIEYN